MPPYFGSGSVQVRNLLIVPFPQMLEQGNHNPKSDQSPSMGQNFGPDIKLLEYLVSFWSILIFK